MDAIGYCSGDIWVRCDHDEGIVALDCGPSNCATVTSDGKGACKCGGLDENGICVDAFTQSSGKAVHLYCLTGANIMVADNCVAETGSANAFCSTFVTSFGYQTDCFCGQCSYQSTSGSCAPLCAGGPCSYDSSLNAHQCP